MEQHEPIALEYATSHSLQPPAEGLWRATVWFVGITGGIGLAILLLYAATGIEVIAMIGALWLYIGALATFIAFITGSIYAVLAWSRKYPPPATVRRAMWAVLLPVLNVLLAIFCIVAGIALASLYHPNRFND